MTLNSKGTPLTEALIDSFPAVDPHVHVPGTISPQTAWDLGIRNKLIHMERDEDNRWIVVDGPNKLGETDPVGQYSNIFCGKGPKSGLPITFNAKGYPTNLDYDYDCVKDKDGKHDTFKGFDAIQGTTQGHRHRPGGIQNESDYRFVMQRYLESCLKQNIRGVETSQNITIAQVLYPELPAKDARRKFFHLCKHIIAEFAERGVALRFTHCANKTGAANVASSLFQRSNEWADWIEEAHHEVPGVFVGLTTAGHEKLEILAGGPQAMVQAYQRVVAMGLGTEAHCGEGAGVEHMETNMDVLPKETRIAHGIQVIESEEALKKLLARNVPLVMMPCININLGGVIHYKDGKPHAKLQRDPLTRALVMNAETGKPVRVEGIENHYIVKLEDHPFFPLIREHGLAVALASDDPQQGGIDYKEQVKQLAGLTYNFPKGFAPLTAEELVLCNLNAVQVAFFEPELKAQLTENIIAWMKEHQISVAHSLLK